MRSKIVVVLSIVFSFLIGIWTGVLLDRRLFRPHPPPGLIMRRRIMEHFERELKLTPHQKEQLRRILEDHRRRFISLHRTFRPELLRIRESLNHDIRGILTPEQRRKFDRMIHRFPKRRHK